MPTNAPPTDDEIRAVVTRLARPHRSGGAVIERAAILAEPGDSRPIFDWITAHAGVPEAAAPAARGRPGGRRPRRAAERALRQRLRRRRDRSARAGALHPSPGDASGPLVA